jgi:hypothetical protein
MDYRRIIRELRDEQARLDSAIAQLEALAGSADGNWIAPRSRRGRKSMGAAERREVSARMKKYWAGRRKSRGRP